MDVSVRDYMSGCMSRNGTFSVARDLFGYIYHDNAQTYEAPLSIKSQIELGKRRSVNVSIINVGHENDFSGVVTRAQMRRIQFAIQVMRNIYAQQNLGVRKIYWSHIRMSQVGGYANIANVSEANDLTDDWSASNDGVDVFFVQTIGDAGGWSNRNGPCDKSSKDGMTGSVVTLASSDAGTGIILAHEVGHYLKLAHGTTITNVMGTDTDGDGIGSTTLASRGLTATQANLMRTHCSIRSSC